MAWQELVKIALLGTERSSLSEEAKELLDTYGLNVKAELPKLILEGAALFSQMNKAGFKLKNFEGTMPAAVKNDGGEICSPRTARHLRLILKGTFEPALPEFIFHLNKNKKQLPPDSLPDLLDQCQKDKELWEKMAPAIGERGHWLLAQNPDWQFQMPSAEPENWATSNKEERLHILQMLRKSAPKQAIELLESTWKEEGLKDKVDFLGMLEANLSKEDEPFLEYCLDEKRKEVRGIAANLLSKIPESGLVQRMIERLVDWMKWEGEQLQINMPDALDKGAQRDGIATKKTSNKGGIKAGWLKHVLSMVSPAMIASSFQRTPTQILQSMLKSDWAESLLEAIIETIVQQPNEKWLDAILNLWIENEGWAIWKSKSFTKSLMHISPTQFNQTAIESLKRNKNMLEEKSAVTQLIQQNTHLWETELSILVIKRFQLWLRNSTMYYWNTWHYKDILKKAAYYSDTKLFDTLKTGWDYQAPIWGLWEPEVEQFFKILAFRREMIKELESK